jgi:hypothetical protein
VEALVVLLFFGLSAGAVGRIKGSSFLIWFCIGFALPLIGTIAALLYRWERREPRRRCDECGKLLALHVQVCPSCGTDLDFPELHETFEAARSRW